MLKSFRRKAIFFAGDIHSHNRFPYVGIGERERLIDYAEAQTACYEVKPGDIGLHRNIGDLSNIAISGFMKHAFIFIDKTQIVEAVSEGVLHRHAFWPLMSDYAVILRPIGISEKAKEDACERALRLAGMKVQYDDEFQFDLEVEESMFADKQTALANIRQYGLGVSCTELVALCYVGSRRKLGIYRTKKGSREVIMPDSYLTTHFQVVWASRHAVPSEAAAEGLHEEGLTILREYWTK